MKKKKIKATKIEPRYKKKLVSPPCGRKNLSIIMQNKI